MKYALLVSIMFGLLAGGVVLAQTEESTDIVTLEDLEIENVGLLPTSPFYFFKELGRGFQSFITFNTIGKAELELKFSNEKVAELKAVEEEDEDNENGIARALENYQGAQERLAARLEALRETSENPNIDRLLEKITERSILHEKLLQEIGGRHEDRAVVKERIEESGRTIANVIKRVEEKDDDAEKFAERLRKALEEGRGGELKDLRSVEILDRISDQVGEDAKERLMIVRDTLQNQLQVRIESLATEDAERLHRLLEDTPGDKSRRTVVLEEIRVRASDVLSNALDRAQDALEEKFSDAADRMEQAAAQIRVAGEVLEKAKAVAREQGEVREAVVELLNQAERHLASAKEAFEAEDYGEAFGQARAAEVVARNALRILTSATDTLAPSTLQRVQERVELKDRVVPDSSVRPSNDVVCTLEFKPVCGADGKTYSNRCIAERQNGVKVAFERRCEDGKDDDSGVNIRLEIDADAVKISPDSVQSSE